MDYDVVIIGAGVVGLAVASSISNGQRKVLVLERHLSFGNETSSRNSEVIHAGIYYPKDSLKAKLCVEGNKSLYDWCQKYNIPHLRIGKYIVAVNSDEENDLNDIYLQAKVNGVENIEPVSKSKINKEEPNIKAVSALWSPDTGIIGSHSLMQSFEDKAKSDGCDFAYKHNVFGIEKISEGFKISINDPNNEPCIISASAVVNSAGIDSDLIAEMTGINAYDSGYRIHYCRGHYFRLSSGKKNLVRHLIYPVPAKNLHNLGIHITKDLAGEIKFGPDVQYLAERKQDYSIPDGLQEIFYESVSKYLNHIELNDFYPDQSGIRPKLQTDGGEYRDFVIKEESSKGLAGFINLIGIESPGLTSCIEIGKMVEKLLF